MKRRCREARKSTLGQAQASRLPLAPHVALGPGPAAGRLPPGKPSGLLRVSYCCKGMSIAVLGPTFQNLAANVHKNVSDIYYIFVGRSLGYLGGSVLGGVLFDCMNAHLLLALSMFGTTVGLYGIPWCKKSLLLTVLMSVIGASMGILDTAGGLCSGNGATAWNAKVRAAFCQKVKDPKSHGRKTEWNSRSYLERYRVKSHPIDTWRPLSG